MNIKILYMVLVVLLSGIAGAVGTKELCQKQWKKEVKKAVAILKQNSRPQTREDSKTKCLAHLISDANTICPKVGVDASLNFYTQNKWICD